MPPDTRLAYPDHLLFLCLAASRLPPQTREETKMEDTIRKNAARAAQENEKQNENEERLRPFPTSYPGGITPDTLFDERSERIIRAQADKLIQTGLFQKHERDDLENEFRVILAYEMAKYDPAKDRYTFTATVLAKRGLNMVIHRNVELKRQPAIVSLDEPAPSGRPFIDLIAAEDERTRREAAVKIERAHRRREDALHRMLEALSPVDVRICEMVMGGSSYSEIGRAVGLAKGSVCKRISRIIRPLAIEFGFTPVNAHEGGDEE